MKKMKNSQLESTLFEMLNKSTNLVSPRHEANIAKKDTVHVNVKSLRSRFLTVEGSEDSKPVLVNKTSTQKSRSISDLTKSLPPESKKEGRKYSLQFMDGLPIIKCSLCKHGHDVLADHEVIHQDTDESDPTDDIQLNSSQDNGSEIHLKEVSDDERESEEMFEAKEEIDEVDVEINEIEEEINVAFADFEEEEINETILQEVRCNETESLDNAALTLDAVKEYVDSEAIAVAPKERYSPDSENEEEETGQDQEREIEPEPPSNEPSQDSSSQHSRVNEINDETFDEAPKDGNEDNLSADFVPIRPSSPAVLTRRHSESNLKRVLKFSVSTDDLNQGSVLTISFEGDVVNISSSSKVLAKSSIDISTNESSTVLSLRSLSTKNLAEPEKPQSISEELGNEPASTTEAEEAAGNNSFSENDREENEKESLEDDSSIDTVIDKNSTSRCPKVELSQQSKVIESFEVALPPQKLYFFEDGDDTAQNLEEAEDQDGHAIDSTNDQSRSGSSLLVSASGSHEHIIEDENEISGIESDLEDVAGDRQPHVKNRFETMEMVEDDDYLDDYELKAQNHFSYSEKFRKPARKLPTPESKGLAMADQQVI